MGLFGTIVGAVVGTVVAPGVGTVVGGVVGAVASSGGGGGGSSSAGGSDIDPVLLQLIEQQHDQAMEYIELTKQQVHEQDQTNRLLMLVEMKGRDIRNAAYDEYTKAGDFLLRQQNAILKEDEQKMGSPEAALPFPEWKPASQVVREAPNIGSDPSVDPARAAIRDAERLEEIAAQVESGGIDSLSDADKAWLEDHGVPLIEEAIFEAAERARREADAISRVLDDQVTDEDIEAFLAWLREIPEEFRADAEELVEAWEHYNKMKQIKAMVEWIDDNYDMSDDSLSTHIEEYYGQAGTDAINYLNEHGIDTDVWAGTGGGWDAAIDAINDLYEQAKAAAEAELQEFADNRGSHWGTWPTADSQSAAIATAEEDLTDEEDETDRETASDLLTGIA